MALWISLQTTAPLYQQRVAVREECNAERMHQIPRDYGDAEFVLFGRVEGVGSGSEFNLGDSRLRRRSLLCESGERQNRN